MTPDRAAYPPYVSTWVALDGSFKDRALWHAALWAAHDQMPEPEWTEGPDYKDYAPDGTPYGQWCVARFELAKKIYADRGGVYEQYIPRRQRRRAH